MKYFKVIVHRLTTRSHFIGQVVVSDLDSLWTIKNFDVQPEIAIWLSVGHTENLFYFLNLDTEFDTLVRYGLDFYSEDGSRMNSSFLMNESFVI